MRSIRWRITAVAVIAVLAALLAVSTALVVLQRSALRAGLDDVLTDRMRDVVVAARHDRLGAEVLPLASEEYVQVVGLDGAVVAASPNLRGKPQLPVTTPTQGPIARTEFRDPAFSEDELRVLSRWIPDVGTVHVGTGTDPVTDSTRALVRSLAWLVPVTTVVLAALVYWLVGRSLRPVEAIRREVATIGAADLARRVPLPETRDEIDRLARTMNTMLARLQASVLQQQQFIADASHELRSPLARMRAQLESASGSDPVVLELLADVVEMQETVEGLLYLARADASETTLDLRPVDLDDVVLREARWLREQSQVLVDVSGVSGAQVEGDPGQLARAVRNLTDNAARHAVSTVRLSLSERDGEAVLVVGDDGPGVPAAEAESVFGRFRRLDPSRAGAGHTGLGLAITRDIAERHGGRVFLVPSDTGARVEFHLPVARG